MSYMGRFSSQAAFAAHVDSRKGVVRFRTPPSRIRTRTPSTKSLTGHIEQQMDGFDSQLFGLGNAENSNTTTVPGGFHGHIASGSSLRAAAAGSVAELRIHGRINARPWHWRQHGHIQPSELVATEAAASGESRTDHDPDTPR